MVTRVLAASKGAAQSVQQTVQASPKKYSLVAGVLGCAVSRYYLSPWQALAAGAGVAYAAYRSLRKPVAVIPPASAAPVGFGLFLQIF